MTVFGCLQFFIDDHFEQMHPSPLPRGQQGWWFIAKLSITLYNPSSSTE
jgi:hypothetical protein